MYCLGTLALKLEATHSSGFNHVIRAGLHRGTGENFSPESTRVLTADGAELSALSYGASLINGRGRRNGNLLPLETFSVEQGQRYR